MELEKLWNSMNEQASNAKISEESLIYSKSFHSKAPMQKINRNLKLTQIWGLFFVLVFSGLAIYHSKNTNIVLLFSFSIAANLISIVYTHYKIKKSLEQYPGQSIKEYLKNYYKQMKTLLNLEERSSVFSIPIYAIVGVLYGGFLLKGSIYEIINDPKILIFTIILLVTIVPLVILFVRWSIKVSFGKYLQDLKLHIDNLEDAKAS